MNNIFRKPGGFLQRVFRISVVGHPVSQDRDRAVSRFAEVVTFDDDGELRVIAVQNQLCDCGAIVREKGNALLGYCSCGALVCESCSLRCSECNALSCRRCSTPALLGDEIFCRRCRGGIPLIKRILIGREVKKK